MYVFHYKIRQKPKSILDFMYFIMKCNRIPKSILDFMYFIMKCNIIEYQSQFWIYVFHFEMQ